MSEHGFCVKPMLVDDPRKTRDPADVPDPLWCNCKPRAETVHGRVMAAIQLQLRGAA